MKLSYEEASEILEEIVKDMRHAAGEFLIPIPEPGTTTARMLLANRMLISRVKTLTSELADRQEKVQSATQVSANHITARLAAENVLRDLVEVVDILFPGETSTPQRLIDIRARAKKVLAS